MPRMSLAAVEKLDALRDEIATAIEAGDDPGTKLDAFAFLWETTPDQEKEGLSYTLKTVREAYDRARARAHQRAGLGKVRYTQVAHRDPLAGREECCR